MVVFTCQNCNSCLKKKAVEKHLFKCKNPQLTCIDCLKDFDTQTYIGHLTCVTENERYGGQAFVPSTAMQKQNQWQQAIHQILQRNISPPVVKNIVQYASENPNCPRIKKKFTNFILNNRAFKSKEAAETAFELISEEFTKSYNGTNQEKSSEDSAASEKSAGGKRKTISETEVHETTDENTESSTQKTSKELNREVEVTNGLTENGTSHKKNKKKDKRTNLVNKIDEESSKTNGHGDEETTEEHNVETHGKKKNKNKEKQRKNSSTEQNLTEDNLECTSEKENTPEDDEQSTKLNGDELVTSELPKEEDLSKLSKKERKKLLKQKKYEAEINSIENYKKEDEVTTQTGEQEGEKRKKKKKKHLVEEEEENRQKKHSLSEPEDKKIKLEDYPVEPEEVEIEKPKKFKWDEVIIQVLRTQDDGEMSLKRLSKKICAEYANVYGERETYEEVMFKFNKKVVRTPGVRVFKDRAKLLAEL